MIQRLVALLALVALCACQLTQLTPEDPGVWRVEYDGPLPSGLTTATTESVTMEVTVTGTPEFLAEEGDARLYFQYRGLSGDFFITFRARSDGLRLSWVIFDIDTRPYVDLCYLQQNGNMTCTQRTQFLVPSGEFKGQWTDFELRMVNDGTEIRTTLSIAGKAFYAELPLAFFPEMVPVRLHFAPTSVTRGQSIRNLVVSNEAAGITTLDLFGCVSEEEFEAISSSVSPSLEPQIREMWQNGRCCVDNSECGTGEECVEGDCIFVPCETSADCGPSQVCNAGVCEPDTCVPLSLCQSRTATSTSQVITVGGFQWSLARILGKQTIDGMPGGTAMNMQYNGLIWVDYITWEQCDDHPNTYVGMGTLGDVQVVALHTFYPSRPGLVRSLIYQQNEVSSPWNVVQTFVPFGSFSSGIEYISTSSGDLAVTQADHSLEVRRTGDSNNKIFSVIGDWSPTDSVFANYRGQALDIEYPADVTSTIVGSLTFSQILPTASTPDATDYASLATLQDAGLFDLVSPQCAGVLLNW